MIRCTDNPNTHIRTFCRRWSFIRRCFFPASILKVDYLTLSWRLSLPYRNQSIDFLRKSMDWFLYDRGLHRERVKLVKWNSSSVNHLETFPQQNSSNHQKCKIKFPLKTFSNQITIICQISFEIYTYFASNKRVKVLWKTAFKNSEVIWSA